MTNNEVTLDVLTLANNETKEKFNAAAAFSKLKGRPLTLADLDTWDDAFINELYNASK